MQTLGFNQKCPGQQQKRAAGRGLLLRPAYQPFGVFLWVDAQRAVGCRQGQHGLQIALLPGRWRRLRHSLGCSFKVGFPFTEQTGQQIQAQQRRAGPL